MNNDNTNFQNERWIPMPDYEEFYLISDYGRIKRIGAVPGAQVGRILQPKMGQYLTIGLSKLGTTKSFAIHRLVARAFMGKKPEGYEVNHIDGNKFNNRLDNLEYCTRSENMRHALKTGLVVRAKGQDSSNSILNDQQVRQIKILLRDTDMTLKAIGDLYNVKFQTIGNIKYGHRWSHITIED